MGKVKSELHGGKRTETETVQSVRIMVVRGSLMTWKREV